MYENLGEGARPPVPLAAYAHGAGVSVIRLRSNVFSSKCRIESRITAGNEHSIVMMCFFIWIKNFPMINSQICLIVILFT